MLKYFKNIRLLTFTTYVYDKLITDKVKRRKNLRRIAYYNSIYLQVILFVISIILLAISDSMLYIIPIIINLLCIVIHVIDNLHLGNYSIRDFSRRCIKMNRSNYCEEIMRIFSIVFNILVAVTDIILYFTEDINAVVFTVSILSILSVSTISITMFCMLVVKLLTNKLLFFNAKRVDTLFNKVKNKTASIDETIDLLEIYGYYITNPNSIACSIHDIRQLSGADSYLDSSASHIFNKLLPDIIDVIKLEATEFITDSQRQEIDLIIDNSNKTIIKLKDEMQSSEELRLNSKYEDVISNAKKASTLL